MTRKKSTPRTYAHIATCKGKRKITNIVDALKAQERMQEKEPTAHIMIYTCTHCGEYHIGKARYE